MKVEIKTPVLGEGIKTATVTSILVKIGDAIKKEQPLIEVESEKASVEIPSPYDGNITSIKVNKGEQLTVGQVFLEIESEEATKTQKVIQNIETQSIPKVEVQLPVESSNNNKVYKPQSIQSIPAAPSVRLLARELGVDIEQVLGTGPRGRISFQDVKDYVKNVLSNKISNSNINTSATNVKLPSFENFGNIQREKLSSIRLKISQKMQSSWQTIPHVTQNDEANISLLEEFRIKKNKELKNENIKITVTAILLKGLGEALKKFPIFNSSLDLANNEVIYKKYIHLGVAVDTQHGLLVPVIRNVDEKSIFNICKELDTLATKARAKKIQADDMQGGSFTLSNLGGLGTTFFTPIINWPEVAILGVGRAKFQTVLNNQAIINQLMLPLSLSYDHRLIDGAQAARFLRFLSEFLEYPLQIFRN